MKFAILFLILIVILIGVLWVVGAVSEILDERKAKKDKGWTNYDGGER